MAAALSLENKNRPSSPIPLGTEWVDNTNDPYLLEDDEDEVMNNDNLADSEDEEFELDPKVGDKEKKVKGKKNPEEPMIPLI